MESPRLIEFPSIGSSQTGFLSVAEQEISIPFDIQRVFWCYQTPETATRGNHAHHELKQVLIALTGTAEVVCESAAGEKSSFVLNRPGTGLLLPPLHWHTITFSPGAVVLALASMPYQERDYIRDYTQFRKMAVHV